LQVPPQYSGQGQYLDNKYLNLFAQFDASAYLDIAKNGYNQEFNNNNGNYSYFPLYPILIWLFSFLVGFGWSAFLISNVLSILGVILFYIVIRQDYDQNITCDTLFYFLLFPVSYFLSVMYTESLFLVIIMLMFYYARRNKWLLVGVLGFLGSLTRMPGLVMFFPMLYMFYKQYGLKFNWRILYLFLIPLGILSIFIYYFFITGDFFMMFHTFANPSYHFTVAIPGMSLYYTFLELFQQTDMQSIVYMILNIIFGIVFILATIFSFRLKQKEYFIYMVFYSLLIFSHTSVNANIRYYFLAFPAFLLISKIKILRKIQMLYYISIPLLAFFVFRHVNEGLYLIEYLKSIRWW
jgi:hypothetical protein